VEERQKIFPGILSYFVSILAKSLIISFQYNIESVYFFYSNPVFGPKMDEVTGEWKRLHKKELYPSPNIIRVIKSRKMRWAGHVAYMGAGEVHKGRRPLARHRCMCENNIKMAVQEGEW
jgi:hypothetical protein